MKNSIFSITAVALIMFAASCKKSSSNNNGSYKTQSLVSYELKAENLNNNVAQKSTSGGVVVWTSGFAYPSMVKFDAKQNGTEIEYKSSNTQRIDLMASNNVDFGNFIIPAGTYDEVELTLQFNKNGSDPAIELNGQFTNNLLSIPVVLVIDDFHEIKTEQHDVVITDNTSFTAVTVLDLAVITSGITEGLLVNAALTNGKIVISSNSNHDLYKVVIDNFTNKKHKCHFDKH